MARPSSRGSSGGGAAAPGRCVKAASSARLDAAAGRLAAAVPVDARRSGSPRSTRSPTFLRSMKPTAGSMRSSTRARPAPSAMAARPSASASMASTSPAAGAGHAPRSVAALRQPAGSSTTRGSPPCASTICAQLGQRRARRRWPPRRRAGAVGEVAAPPRQHQHLGGERQGELAQVGRAAARAAASIASTTSRALPTARPSGWSMSVSRAVTRLPAPRPMPISVSASARALVRGLHEGAAPRP